MTDHLYDALADVHTGDERWAFGTGFTDALEGIDTTVPSDLDADALAAYCLMLGDDALVLSHRLQQWVTRLPELEEETAVANIALDLLGQARMLLARAGTILGRSEDELAYFRDAQDFRNVRLVEPVDEDFAQLVIRLMVFSTWRLALFEQVQRVADPVLAAIAAKGIKELRYHRDYAAGWVVRLGDGTEVSHDKAAAAVERLWPLVPELWRHCAPQSALGVEPPEAAVLEVLSGVFRTATLDVPEGAHVLGAVDGRTGRDGMHTEALGYLLAELQSVARADPEATW
ncbi:1,2-phenylacetyl-CoA epoxidase subunit PaaC [Allobranchiibius huperziae]|uniref:Ring-1,2-phenylacetyl-CoA epoxidase subunit PaaC n=1 Tax=Allobranchiibius huperziae TaxID=1874116 RepID=A0A853DMS8_9MICO|nr:1,2-phenylacetyl-CoA epoxidase subunit PaaC [Allobranchiibius huperziae]NYJ75435.1 ring-1,2-phenylacetyl-CoA epoxidase subunit PaaC [Allobranchiibius huperziae]